jgi:hypothetical protein
VFADRAGAEAELGRLQARAGGGAVRPCFFAVVRRGDRRAQRPMMRSDETVSLRMPAASELE